VAYFAPPSPNPFNAATRLGIHLDRPAEVRLYVYDVLGRRVRVLWEGGLDAGARTLTWDARDDRGVKLGSGVYLARLEAEGLVATRKLLLLK
jgi:flagellar hook assembly protein FlgD